MSTNAEDQTPFKMEAPRFADIAKQVGIPSARKPVAGLLFQVCAAIANVCGLEHACSRAMIELEKQPLSATDLAKKIGLRRRAALTFAEHLVEKHGIVQGNNCYGYSWNVIHTTDYIDSVISACDPDSLRGVAPADCKSLADIWVERMHFAKGNLVAVYQALVALWIVVNFPGAEALCKPGHLSCETFAAFYDLFYGFGEIIVDTILFFTSFYEYVFVRQFIGIFIVFASLLVILVVVRHFCRVMHKCFERLIFERRQKLSIAEKTREYDIFVNALRSDTGSYEAKRQQWIDRGYPASVFSRVVMPLGVKPEKVKPECINPTARANEAPFGGLVRLYGANSNVKEHIQQIGCGGVLKREGERLKVITSGHVAKAFMGHTYKRITVEYYSDFQWKVHEISTPLVTNYVPGSDYAAATFQVQCKEKFELRGWQVTMPNINQPMYMARRSIVTKLKNAVFHDQFIVYNGDTVPGDSGSVIYQNSCVVAIHQGTWDMDNLSNFASIGEESCDDVVDLHNGYAEVMSKVPKRKNKIERYVLKAASYDGNQFGALLEKVPWAYTFDFQGKPKLLMVTLEYWLAGQLLLWDWQEWVKAGRPKHLDGKLLSDIIKGKAMKALGGTTWDGKTTARMYRLIGRRIYPVPSDEHNVGVSYSKDEENFISKSRQHEQGIRIPTPTAREVLLTRFYVDHAMVMDAKDWEEMKNAVQKKEVDRVTFVKNEDGKHVRTVVPTQVEHVIGHKIKNLREFITKQQFYDKEYLCGLYAGAMEQKLIAEDQVPNILAGFGSRAVLQYMEKASAGMKEWYTAYAQNLNQFYPEGEEEDFDEVVLEEEGEDVIIETPPATTPSKEIITPPAFREKHATCSEQITIDRLVALENAMQALTEKFTEILDRTNRASADAPEIKTALFDLTKQMAQISSKALGQTISDNERDVVPKPVQSWEYCKSCDKEIQQVNWNDHINGIKHFKKTNKVSQPEMPSPVLVAPSVEHSEMGYSHVATQRMMVPIPESRETKVFCEPCNRSFDNRNANGIKLHWSSKGHQKKVLECEQNLRQRYTEADQYSFLGVGPAQPRGHYTERTRPRAPQSVWRSRSHSPSRQVSHPSPMEPQPSGSQSGQVSGPQQMLAGAQFTGRSSKQD